MSQVRHQTGLSELTFTGDDTLASVKTSSACLSEEVLRSTLSLSLSVCLSLCMCVCVYVCVFVRERACVCVRFNPAFFSFVLFGGIP